jgi:hypothetical protein
MGLNKFTLRFVASLGLTLPVLAAIPGRPGTVNYVEGQVSVDGQDLGTSSIGSAELKRGAVLRTGSGKAEVLLTPGVFLRLGSNSEMRMTSSGLLDTRVVLDRGVALLEATDVDKDNNIEIADGTLNTLIEKKGLYRFDSDRSSISTFDGKAEVRLGDEKVEVKKGKEVVAGDGALKVEKFDRGEAKETDELYKWSKLRSKYLSEASVATAQRILVQPGGWYGSGWYWNPFMRTYSWLPAGSAYYSPFGYGFYSPWSAYSPIYIVPRYRTHPRVWSSPERRVHREGPGRSSGGGQRSSPSGRVRGR